MEIIWRGSPNQDGNRVKIDRIVIHWFGMGTLEGAHATFQKAGGTSAHYGISDKRIWQWVKEDRVAYHAGNYAMNQRSIGIEHDANPDKPLSEDSYKTSAWLIADIAKRYSIPLDRTHVIAHKEVKATQCPGTIDLDKLINLAKGAPPESNTMLVYLGVPTEAEAKTKLKEHLGEANGKCNWGGNPGGHLGSERAKKAKLQDEKAVLAAQNSDYARKIAELETKIKELSQVEVPSVPPSSEFDEALKILRAMSAYGGQYEVGSDGTQKITLNHTKE